MKFEWIRYLISKCLQMLIASFYRNIYKMNIGKNVFISHNALLDKANPRGIHIGNNSWITSGVKILTHDHTRELRADTYIGNKVFIGVNAIVLPGVRIEDNVIVAAGAVVTKDISANTIVAGNPATIIRKNIQLTEDVILIDKGEKV